MSMTVPMVPLQSLTSVHKFLVNITVAPLVKRSVGCNDPMSSAGSFAAVVLLCFALTTAIGLFSDHNFS